MIELNKPPLISAIHLKGGCGKTTLLTDIGINLCLSGQNVLAIDADMQGSMFTTLTGEQQHRYLPSNRHRYLENLQNGVGIKFASTKYLEVNKRLRVMHYPIQMFSPDDFYQPKFTAEFLDIVAEKIDGVSAVLFDLPPTKLESSEVQPFLEMDPLVSCLYFLIVTRPNPKELDDGGFCYSAMRELLGRRAFPPDKLNLLPILNFSRIQGRSTQFVMNLDSLGRLYSYSEGKPVIVESVFPSLKSGETKMKSIPNIHLPTVPRSGKDMRHYSIFLDEAFNWDKVDKDSPESIKDPSDWIEDLLYGSVEEELYDKNYPLLKVHREYLSTVRQICRVLVPPIEKVEALEDELPGWGFL